MWAYKFIRYHPQTLMGIKVYDGSRTHNQWHHKPPLCQLSYAHSCRSRIWTDISFLMREVCYQVHVILQSGYRDLNSGPLAPKASALAKLSHTPKWNGFVLLLPSASTFIEGISRDLAPVYYPPYGHSSSFCGTLLQGLSTTYVSHLPFLILYKYYNKIFIKNQLNNFAIFLLVATPTY